MTTAILYCRVSSLSQVEGASLDAQEAILRAECQRRGWDALVMRQEGRSAKSLNRPVLTEARRLLNTGEAHVLLAVVSTA